MLVRARVLALSSVLLAACSGSIGETDPAADDLDASSDGALVDGATDEGEGAPRDATPATDAAAEVEPGDAADTAVPDSAPEDAAPEDTGDPLALTCKGWNTSPFQPPTVCDKLSGNTTSTKPSNSIYSTSWFGCYRKSDGTIYKDPYDNCEFACGPKGLCDSSATGPECQAELQWFAADADRFGCGGRIRVTNCANGKQVVLAALDRGPNCKSVEQAYGVPVLDMSHPAMTYLFDGKTYGGSDEKRVVVEEVGGATPLGPVTP